MKSDSSVAVRDAATLIVLRDRYDRPSILMGQRGAQAAFMPNKFVFPGGALDSHDAFVPLASQIGSPCYERLADECVKDLQHALGVAAVRELWEETGMVLGSPGSWADEIPENWRRFAQSGFLPTAAPLQFFFRALTPPGRPRRFDARFFLVEAHNLCGDLDDFAQASDELRNLQWVPLQQARDYNLPFITEVVLAEVEGRIQDPSPPPSVPYFMNTEETSRFLRLRGGL